MRLALLTVLLLLAYPSYAELDERIQVTIEEPVQGERYSGISNLRGWAVSPEGMGSYYLEVFIDEEFAFYMYPYGKRTDVGNAFPDYPGSDTGGFSMAFNYKDLSPGEHEIKVRAFDNANNYNDAVTTFTTERFESSFIASDSDVDLSTSETWAIVDKQTYKISGATLEGKQWEFLLTWDRASQGFKTERIVPFGSGSSGGSNEGGGSDLYVCATSTTRSFNSSSTTVTMKNGAELNNYDGRSWDSRNSYLIFRTSNGKWYALEEHYDPFNTPSYEVFRIDLISEPQSCFEPDLFQITGIEEGFTSNTYSWSGGSLRGFDRQCGIEVGAYVYIFTTSEYEWEVMLDVETAEDCQSTAVQ